MQHVLNNTLLQSLKVQGCTVGNMVSWERWRQGVGVGGRANFWWYLGEVGFAKEVSDLDKSL